MESFNLYGVPMLLREDGSTPWVFSQVSLPFPNRAQVFVLCYKGRSVCAPLYVHVTTVPQGAPSHTQRCFFFFFNFQPMVSSLCSPYVQFFNLPKERTHSLGVPGGLTSSPTKLVVVPETSITLVIYGELCQTLESCPHISIRTHTSTKCSLYWACPSNGRSTHALDLIPTAICDVPKYSLPPTLAYLQP
jgi:hypothetical protein